HFAVRLLKGIEVKGIRPFHGYCRARVAATHRNIRTAEFCFELDMNDPDIIEKIAYRFHPSRNRREAQSTTLWKYSDLVVRFPGIQFPCSGPFVRSRISLTEKQQYKQTKGYVG